MSDFEVVSYDVNGLGDDRKRRKIFNYMKKTHFWQVGCIFTGNSFNPKSRKVI